MKKFKTSEDLDEILISIPLNKARTILTMCLGTVEKMILTLQAIEEDDLSVSTEHRAFFQGYIDDYKMLRTAIEEGIAANVSKEDQVTITEYETTRAKSFREQLEKTLEQDALFCSDADQIKQEFDLKDLPEGTVMSPGSDEEN